MIFKLLLGCIKLLLPLPLLRIRGMLLRPVFCLIHSQLELGVLLQLLIQKFLIHAAGLLLHLDCISAHFDVVLPLLVAHLNLSSLGELFRLPLVQHWCCSLCGHFNIGEVPFSSFNCSIFDHRCWLHDQQSSWSFIHLHRLMLFNFLMYNLLFFVFLFVFSSWILLFFDFDIFIDWSVVSCTSVWFF